MITAVYVLWIIALAVVVLLLPVVLYALSRLLQAALHIKRYTADMLTAGLGVAGNTKNIAALEDTIQTATTMLSVAGNIDQHSAAIENLLSSRAAKGGHLL